MDNKRNTYNYTVVAVISTGGTQLTVQKGMREAVLLVVRGCPLFNVGERERWEGARLRHTSLYVVFSTAFIFNSTGSVSEWMERLVIGMFYIPIISLCHIRSVLYILHAFVALH